MGPTAIAAIVIILVSAGASFFFALAETAVFSLSQWQVRQLADRDPRSGGILTRLLADPQDLLATMVLGNTFASAAMLAVAFWMALHDRWPAVPSILSLLALTLFGCEVLPKTLAVRKPEHWSLRVARPLMFLEKFSLLMRGTAQGINRAILASLAPGPAQALPGLTDEEYHELIELAYQQGTLASPKRRSSCRSSRSTGAPRRKS